MARFIVQDVAQRDIYSVGGFGGNLIDVELLANPGNDNFIEIQPMLNIETVVNAQTARGRERRPGRHARDPAHLRPRRPARLREPVEHDRGRRASRCRRTSTTTISRSRPAPSTRSIQLVPRIRMDTAVTNVSGDEQQMLVGDWYNPGGQLEAWVRPNRLGEALSSDFSVISHFGYGEFEGLDYGYTTLPAGSHGFRARRRRASSPPVASPCILHSTSVLARAARSRTRRPSSWTAGARRTFSRFLGVGDGSGSNAVAMEAAVKAPHHRHDPGLHHGRRRTALPGSRVSVFRGTPTNVTRFEASVVTDATPCSPGSGPNYEAKITLFGRLAGGGVAARHALRGLPRRRRPSTPSAPRSADGTYTVNIDLPAPGRLSAHVTDEAGLPSAGARERGRHRPEPAASPARAPACRASAARCSACSRTRRRRCPSASSPSATATRTATWPSTWSRAATSSW